MDKMDKKGEKVANVESLKLTEKKILLLIPKLEQVLLSEEFIRGIAVGLFYGIVGNIIVLHYHKAFERFMLGEFDTLLWANLIVFIAAFSSILVITIKWRNKWQKLEKHRHAIFEAAEMLRDYYYELMKEGKEEASEKE